MNQVRKTLSLGEPVATGRGSRVAILDTGLDISHPDFAGRVLLTESESFTLRDDLDDRDGHGTHVAGIIAGSGALSSGVYRGIAPEAEVLVLKVASVTRGYDSAALAGLEAAIRRGAHIINYSHGLRPPESVGPPPWVWPMRPSISEEAFQAASDAGILCVVAAGNAGPVESSITKPGGLECVLTVGAIDHSGVVWESSSRGPYRRCPTLRTNRPESYSPYLHHDIHALLKPDVVAPGVGVTAVRSRQIPLDREAQPFPPYHPMTGTSQATAVVSGIAALLLDLCRRHGVDLGPRPGLTLKRLICYAARAPRVGERNAFGEGTLVWPVIVQTLGDFATDHTFRDLVFNGPDLKLLE